MFNAYLVPIAREGRPFILAFAVGTLLLWMWVLILAVPGLVLTAWCVYFFRDPDRVTPTRADLVISPADGRVVAVGPAPWPKELEMGEDGAQPVRIGIFMDVFDCHVNRVPIDGKILKLAYVQGAFVNASFDKASEENERQIVMMESRDKQPIAFVQIAGLVARRIVCKLTEGQDVLAGERMGLIRFGSRVDVYLPPETAALVDIGQRCVSGETVLADLASEEPRRTGATR